MNQATSGDRPPRFTLPKVRRIVRQGDFRRTYTLRASAADRRIVVYARRNGTPLTRIGLSVGRKQGNSVFRNRVKRLLREAFRLSRHDLPEGYDLIIVPRDVRTATMAHLKESLLDVAARAIARAEAKQPRDSAADGEQNA